MASCGKIVRTAVLFKEIALLRQEKEHLSLLKADLERQLATIDEKIRVASQEFFSDNAAIDPFVPMSAQLVDAPQAEEDTSKARRAMWATVNRLGLDAEVAYWICADLFCVASTRSLRSEQIDLATISIAARGDEVQKLLNRGYSLHLTAHECSGKTVFCGRNVDGELLFVEYSGKFGSQGFGQPERRLVLDNNGSLVEKDVWRTFKASSKPLRGYLIHRCKSE